MDIMAPAFSSFSAVLAQSDEDKERLESLGAVDVQVTGSVKFDIRPDLSQVATARALAARLTRPVVLIASTREGEEAMFAEALKTHADLMRKAHVVLVPRHPERFDRVEALLKESGFRVARRSQLQAPEELPPDTDVILGDSMGEMSFYCALASVTIMGGSFAPCGSQNVIEPAMAGSPVVVGPSTFNFERIIREGIVAGGMVQVKNAAEALDVAQKWLADPQERDRAGARAADFARRCAGATGRMMAVLEKLWTYARKNESRMY